MDNNNGALSFDVLIRDSNIEKMLAKDEQRIKDFTENVEKSSESIVQSFGNIGTTVAGLAITATLKSWVSDIINVRGEFQQLEIAFGTMLGSEQQAQTLMQQLTTTAATTPFDLKGVAQSAKQLLAYGEAADNVNDTLVRLGNIASGLSIPLNDLTYLYGTTMVQGRLFTQDVRQFMGRGIPLVQELGKALGKTTDEINQMVTDGKIGFEEVKMVIENLTNQGGMFYGLMEEQSKSLTGQISNLGDAWDMMLNELGQKSEGVLSGGISAVTTLVENYDTCLKVLGRLVAVYGSYKVALAAVAIAQKKSTGFTSIDNMVAKARMGLFTSLGAQAQQAIRNNQLMTASQQAYTAELQKCLTLEQQEQILRNLRIQAIMQMLTAEQQVYVSRLKETEGTAAYLAQLEAVLTTEQQVALSKKNLSANSMAYSVAVEQAVAATQSQIAAELAATKAEAAQLKQKQVMLAQEYRTSLNKIEATRVQIALAQQEGNATAVAALKEQQYNQLQQHSVIVKNMKSTATAKEAATEKIATLAKQQGALASKAEAASDTMLATTKNLLGTAVKGVTASMRALWATMIANPITAIITAVTTLISVFTMFGSKTEEEKTIQGEFQDAMTDTYSKLNTYFAILKNADSSTKAYKDALGQINQLCSEHHVELLKENAALDEQVKAHDALIESMERETAARLKAKYIEQAMAEVNDANAKSLKKLQDAAEEATYKTIETVSETTPEGVTIQVAKVVDAASSSIRGANEALWEAVITMANENAGKLAGLEGAALEEEHAKLVNAITQSVQDATHASSKEMEEFKPVIEEVIDEVIRTANTGSSQVALVESQVNAMFASFGQQFNTEQVAEKVDLLTLSFAELDKQAAEAKAAIEKADGSEINVTVGQQTFTQLATLQNYLNEINNAIGQKTTNLNTENGINARIKELKALRAEAELGSAEWKEYDKQISTLEGKLPSSHKAAASAAGKAANAAQRAADAQRQAAQKAVDVALEVERKRIDTIKDGYKQRKAELELEHKHELARIGKEQADLEAVYKKAKKPMPADVKANFEKLKTLENASYEQKQTELLQQEMEVRQKQYQQYYSWVTRYGKQVADEQFAELIEQGNSYEAWLQSKVNELQAKMAAGEKLSLEQGNTLINMQGQLDELHGVKSAMDSFNESIMRAKDNAATMTDYLTELANRKQALMQGKTNLVGEDRAKAIVQVDKEITEQTEALQKQLLEQYRTNAQLREDVEREYQQEITWLQQHGYTEQAAVAEKARKKAVSELAAQQVQSSDIWQQMFRDAEYLSGSAFDAIKEKLKALIEDIEDADVKKDLLDQLDDLQRQTQGSRNPFKQLVNSIKEYNNAASGTADKKQKLMGMFTDIGSACDMVKQSFDSIVDGLKKMGLAGDEETQKMLGDISEMMGGAGQLAKGIATMNPVDMISGGVSLITSAISLFDSSSRRIRREMKEHEKQLGILQRMYAQVQWNVENSVGEEYYKNQQEAIKNLQQQQQEYKRLAELEQSKKSKDRDDGKVQEYLKSAEDAERQIKDIEREITETLVQTSFKDLANDLADTWAEAFGNMEDSTEEFDKIFAQTITNAVKNALKLKIIEPVVNDFTNAMADYMGIHNNSLAGFDFARWKKTLQTAGEAFTNGLDEFKEFFEALGDATDDAADTLEGQVASVTEETASKLAGEITTMRIRQYEMLTLGQGIEAACVQATASIRNCITYLQTIAQNTSYNRKLVDITQQLEQLNSKIEASDPLRAKGITY